MSSAAVNATAALIKVKVNGVASQLASGKLLPALRAAGFRVPSVCYHPDVEHSGGRCRVCVCKVNGRTATPCNMPVEEGMDIVTESSELTHDRVAAFALIPNAVNMQGKSPETQMTDELQAIAKTLPPLPTTAGMSYEALPIKQNDKKYVISHPDKCVHCGLCVQMCAQIQGLGAIAEMRKPHRKPSLGEEAGGVHAFHDTSLFLSECVSCGQCINVCPYGALEEVSEVDAVDALLKDESKVKVVQFAPAVRVALAEEFGCEPGTRSVTQEMVGALRKIAKNTAVYDTSFTADLTIVEEAAELLERLRRTLTKTRKYGPDNEHMEISLPMITSCSPGWVLFCEKNYHELLPHLSTCKSPQQMHGAITKHYWAHKHGYEPKDVTAISIMPCVAKKVEKDRPEFSTDGHPDVDHVLTTREFAKLLKKNNINLLDGPCEDFDISFGLATSAGLVFGATGGVMEAALRTAYNIITGRDVPFKGLEITAIRGMEGVRIRTIPLRDVLPEWAFLEGVDLKVAVAHGIANARKLMERIRERKVQGLPQEVHFVEVMCCPGGCLGGGGQPKPINMEIKKKRGTLIYQEAAGKPMHRSHDNPRILSIYRDFLGEVGGHRAHKLLHTPYYTPRHAAASELLQTEDAKGVQRDVLSKYARSNVGLTNLLCEVVDQRGYVSDAVVAAIADHVKTTPVDIDAVISHYHFFQRHAVPQSMIYLCECANCRLRGSREVKAYLKANQIPYHMTSWLGWCVNGGPAALVKHVGDPCVHAMLNIDPQGDPRLQLAALDSFVNPVPALNYKVLDSTRLFGPSTPSVLWKDADNAINVTNVVQTARKVTAMSPDEVIAEIRNAQLRGCGGAGFPSHIKWTGVKNEPVADGVSKYVVINADEGLPCTFKDYHLLQDATFRLRLFNGIAIAAHATGATKALLYLRYEYKNLRSSLLESFAQYAKLNTGLASRLTFEVILGGGPYVCGEETALFESVEGHLPQARVERTIFPTKHGVFGMPTLVSNVETLSWVHQILDHGADAVKRVQSAPDQVGLKLLSVSGDIPQPVLAEFPIGTSLMTVLRETTGYPIADVAAVEVGGILEPLTFPDAFENRIVSLDNRGDHLSAGGSVVIWRKGDRFNERYLYQAKAKFGNVESCQLCAPCREGSGAMRDSVMSLFEGSLLTPESAPQRRRLQELALAMEHSSNCGHGKACGKMSRLLIDHLSSSEHRGGHTGTFC